MGLPVLFPNFTGLSVDSGGSGGTVMIEALSVNVENGTERVAVNVESGGDTTSVSVNGDRIVVTVEEDD